MDSFSASDGEKVTKPDEVMVPPNEYRPWAPAPPPPVLHQ